MTLITLCRETRECLSIITGFILVLLMQLVLQLLMQMLVHLSFFLHLLKFCSRTPLRVQVLEPRDLGTQCQCLALELDVHLVSTSILHYGRAYTVHSQGNLAL